MKYTYEQMWDDTSDIVEKYGWELHDIEDKSDHYIVTIYNYEFETEVQFVVENDTRMVTDCYINGGGNKSWLYDKVDNVIFQLKHMWLEFDKAIPQFFN